MHLNHWRILSIFFLQERRDTPLDVQITYLEELRSWPRLHCIRHFHIQLPMGSSFYDLDPDIDKFQVWSHYPGCIEIAALMKRVSSLETLTFAVDRNQDPRVQELLEPLLSLPQVKKTICIANHPITIFRNAILKGRPNSCSLESNAGDEVHQEHLRNWESVLNSRCTSIDSTREGNKTLSMEVRAHSRDKCRLR